MLSRRATAASQRGAAEDSANHRGAAPDAEPSIHVPVTEPMPGGQETKNNIRLFGRIPKLSLIKHVEVESWPGGLTPEVLWATDRIPQERDQFFPHVEAQLITFDPGAQPRSGDNGNQLGSGLVFQGDDFEIRVVGMSVSSMDSFFSFLDDKNELVLYSTESQPLSTINAQAESAPQVHFDYKREQLVRPDQYQPIASGKSLVLREMGSLSSPPSTDSNTTSQATQPPPPSAQNQIQLQQQQQKDAKQALTQGSSIIALAEQSAQTDPPETNPPATAAPEPTQPTQGEAATKAPSATSRPRLTAVIPPRKSISVTFKIIEMEEAAPLVRGAIDSVTALGPVMATLTAALPYFAVISPAVSLVGHLGRAALDSYARPQKALQADMSLRVMSREAVEGSRPGEYLAYGWYFYLSKPVAAKLYATTLSASSVRLMMLQKNPRQFVPLTHVSYLVVRVCPTQDSSDRVPTGITPDQALRLQRVVENVHRLDASVVKQDIVEIIHGVNSPFLNPVGDYIAQPTSSLSPSQPTAGDAAAPSDVNNAASP